MDDTVEELQQARLGKSVNLATAAAACLGPRNWVDLALLGALGVQVGVGAPWPDGPGWCRARRGPGPWAPGDTLVLSGLPEGLNLAKCEALLLRRLKT